MALDTAQRSKVLMKRLGREAAQLLDAYREAKLKASGEWNPGARRELLATLDTAYTAQITEIQMAHKAAAEAFTAEIGAIRGAPGKLGTDETLGWERLRSHLERAAARGSTMPDVQTAMRRLEKAQASGDFAMIRAARAMLPDYLGAPLARDHRNWLDIQAGSDETRAAVALDEEGRRGIPLTRQAVNWVAAEIGGQVENVSVLPGWDGSVTHGDLAPDYAGAQRAATADAAETLAAAGYRPTSRGTIAKTGGSGPASAPAGGADTV